MVSVHPPSRIVESVEEKGGINLVRHRDKLSLSREIIKEQLLLIEELSGSGSSLPPKSSPGRSKFDASSFAISQVHAVDKGSNFTPAEPSNFFGTMRQFHALRSEVLGALEANEGIEMGDVVPTWEKCLEELEDVARGQSQAE